MIKINLLPYHEKAKKDTFRTQVFILVGTLVVYLLLLGLVWSWVTSSINNLESRKVEAEKTIADLDKKIGDLEKFKKDKKEFSEKLDVIETLEENRLVPVKTLDSLATLVPSKDIWLVKITQRAESMKIEGVGRDNVAVADFMKSIEKFDPIKSVELDSSKQQKISDVLVQQFSFACVLKKGF